MNQYCEKFQRLLRELFQFDCADLDFGIYRIMNYKRGVIEKFITQDLPKAVAEELDRGALADQSQAAAELKDVKAQISESLGPEALDADGRLAETYHGTPLGKKYMALRAKAAGGRGREALEAAVFNHLFAFFSRYYQDGDFISKRRYSKRERYAVPYNGEEVYLYWANNDQYYVKTAEHFHDYTFTSRGVTVHFRLQGASVEQNNVKGDKRFFLPRTKETAWDEKAGEIVIPFEYRPLTEQEEITYGKKNQQDAIIAEALAEVPKRLKKADQALAALTAERRKTSDGQSVTFLEHHLRQYTRRNTSDFFIHKDLKGFLSRELDFYLKNEVLNLDEMETAGEDRAEGWFQITRVIKAVGGRIIDFLAQIESFQKMLWEKRKFVTETQYCITVGNIDEALYAEIAGSEPQWAEWKELFHIDEEATNLFTAGKNKKDKRVAFLKAHPTLVLDTRHLEADFVDRLLASIDDLDGKTDGLLIHSENFQAISLLLSKYREGVDCIYIDPPYNTSENTFLYKNSYKHSSWVAMMANRIGLCRLMLPRTGVIEVAIDDTETGYLRNVMDALFSEGNRVATIAVEVNPAGQNLRPNTPALSHDYCHVYAANISAMNMLLRELTEGETETYQESDGNGAFLWDNLRRRGGNSRPTDRPGQWFPLFITGSSVRVPKMEWDASSKRWLVKEKPRKGEEEAWPIDPKGEKRIWRVNPDGARRFIDSGDIAVTVKAGRKEIVKKSYMPEGKKPKTLWKDPKYSATTHGTKLLIDILGAQLFSYPKSLYLVVDCLRFWADEQSNVFDYFAGSGTTGHAVISLNREDGGSRNFIMAEMGQYFDTVLMPRIKKVTFTPEWKDGKPKRMATAEEAERSPRIVKVIRLESYEDALNNIEFDDASGQQALKFDDYLLQYMLKWEARASETLLNVEKMARPFCYKLHVHADGETREKIADVPETFNYLLGLHVETRRAYDDGGRRYLVYRGRIDHRQVAVIWRETEGWKKADLERDKKFVAEQKLIEGADEVFVNGDSFIPNAKALEPVFKARMFAPVEA